MIGGYSDEEEKKAPPFAKKAKRPSMIGGPEEEPEEAPAPEEAPMDAEAQKIEAARILFPDNPKRALQALEAFIYACKSE